MSSHDNIRFVLDSEIVELNNVDPTRTVLQYLREDRRRKGSKEGCAEGDCGACTVVLAELNDDGTGSTLKAVNSCIQFLPTLDGKQLLTVESLADGGTLHPVQQAMVDEHGSQCGFCTPGFVMSLFALYESNRSPTRTEIDDALAGNLCRCTGYRPIIAAATSMQTLPATGTRVRQDALLAVQRDSMLEVRHGGRAFLAPRSVAELAQSISDNPGATLLAGGTDVGLWVTKQHRDLGVVIYTGRVQEMLKMTVTSTHLEIGAAVALSEAAPLLVQHFPDLDELFRRFASPPIRNAGTLGGNIANGSPIGDSMAALMVVGSTLQLRSADRLREIGLDEFYIDYQVNALQPGEFLQCIRIPLPDAGTIVKSHKWSKRFDQDISAVCTAYALRLDDGLVTSFRMACGGMAATISRAPHAEAILTGARWDENVIDAACAALAKDFSPISDMRADAESRMLACQNLLRRFYAETVNTDLPTVYNYGR